MRKTNVKPNGNPKKVRVRTMVDTEGFKLAREAKKAVLYTSESEIRKLGSVYTARAMEVLIKIMMSDDAKNSDKLKAVDLLFNRTYGKAKETVQVEHNNNPDFLSRIMNLQTMLNENEYKTVNADYTVKHNSNYAQQMTKADDTVNVNHNNIVGDEQCLDDACNVSLNHSEVVKDEQCLDDVGTVIDSIMSKPQLPLPILQNRLQETEQRTLKKLAQLVEAEDIAS